MGGVDLSVKPTLRGELTVLRPVTEADAASLARLEPETLRLTGSQGSVELGALQAWYRTRADHDDRLDLSIVHAETGAWLGEVVLNDLDRANRSCGFRILLSGPSVYGRGYGTEASRLILGHAFDGVGIHRVELQVYRFNPRARHVYEKLGFVHEGTRRQALWWDGEWVDADHMALLAEEWAPSLGAGTGKGSSGRGERRP